MSELQKPSPSLLSSTPGDWSPQGEDFLLKINSAHLQPPQDLLVPTSNITTCGRTETFTCLPPPLKTTAFHISKREEAGDVESKEERVSNSDFQPAVTIRSGNIGCIIVYFLDFPPYQPFGPSQSKLPNNILRPWGSDLSFDWTILCSFNDRAKNMKLYPSDRENLRL